MNYLERLDYGNGDSVDYTYDSQGRLTKETFEDGDTVTYTYNNSGNLATVTDSATGITTIYYYDLIDRLAKYWETGGNRDHSVEYTYDSNNNLSSVKERISGTDHTTAYVYDEDNRLTSVSSGLSAKEYTYDSFGRVTTEKTKHNSVEVLEESYTFRCSPITTFYTSTQVATNRLQAAGYDVTYTYTYDGNGNILSISDGTNTTTYVYDSANQLIRENNEAAGFTYIWAYDSAGNILSRKEYAYTTGTINPESSYPVPIATVNYTYGGDRLASYNGQSIFYDGIGNPLMDGTWMYVWEHGRELMSMSNDDVAWEFTYDANGMRTGRTDFFTGYTYTYVYNGGSLSQMTVGNNTLYFAYDAAGQPMTVTYNGTVYYYVTNLQGDVIAILDSAGTPVVTYTYDAWGHPLTTTGTMASTLGTHNPLRYRGYVFDQETHLYYLQSRYYNPTWGRFLNADSYVSTGQGLLGNNMFAYCLNNPVKYTDKDGESADDYWGWVGEQIGIFLYEWITGDDHPQSQIDELNTQIIQEQNEMIANTADALWDAYVHSNELQMQAQYEQDMAIRDTVENTIKSWKEEPTLAVDAAAFTIDGALLYVEYVALTAGVSFSVPVQVVLFCVGVVTFACAFFT